VFLVALRPRLGGHSPLACVARIMLKAACRLVSSGLLAPKFTRSSPEVAALPARPFLHNMDVRYALRLAFGPRR
jgi:hypothetical protein